jgi:UDP-glucuronate 4-epimerase
VKILLTGAAGFIGFYVAQALLNQGDEVIGLDNINDYYDINLKYARLDFLGIHQADIVQNKIIMSCKYDKFSFIQMNVEDRGAIRTLFERERFDKICHLAAQAGVRYSLENPYVYIDSNIHGFLNILENCRHHNIQHLVYASSSSVYGLNGKIPFSEKDGIAHPVSLYAATKKSNELMAHVYSSLFNISTTGLRFFTVYGPWGRPDMSPFLFIDAILHDRPIKVFNNGDMWRDFTYIDDIVEFVIKAIDHRSSPNPQWKAEQPDPNSSSSPYRIYNIGNSSPVKLMDYIQTIEKVAGKKAIKNFLPMQAGDVYQTYADISSIMCDFGSKPHTSLFDGITKTVHWFKKFYKIY